MRLLPSTGRWAVAIGLACLGFPLPLWAAQDIHGNPITAVGQDVPVDVGTTYYTQRHPCPKACLELKSPDDWTVYPKVERLQFCNQPMLLRFAVFNTLEDATTPVLIKACTFGDANDTTNPFLSNSTDPTPGTAVTPRLLRRDNATSSGCMQFGENSQADFDLLRSGSGNDTDSSSVLELLNGMHTMLQNASFCGQSILFGYANGVSVGLYTANMFAKATVLSALENLESEIKENGLSPSVAAQFCGGAGNSNNTAPIGAVGISVDTTGPGSLVAVQADVAAWAKGHCLDRSTTGQLTGVSLWGNTGSFESTALNSTLRVRSPAGHRLQPRDSCSTTTVQQDDSCATLAARCGISGADFMKYNNASDFCATLMPNQKVCCSAGTLPVPQKNADGSCFAYTTQLGDTCSSVALSNGLTPVQVEKFNDGKTWNWSTCTPLDAGINICLSDGTPPLPAPYDNAVCGPYVPGTAYPTDGTALADLNPCPLNACCDAWGNCGITAEFCTVYKSPTNNPGYNPPNLSSCISSCGQNITNTDKAPDSYGRIGYWESWNMDRPCLNLKVNHANTDGTYTIIHWAFGTIDTSDFTPQINDTYKQWDDFTQLQGVKKVISFGGWGYSTDPATYDILREAMSPTNRATFAKNVASFLTANNLDGVDFDWEYPGATDIEGAPGQADDGINYLKFLITLRGTLPAGKTISIAAPASYWYLKQFPIQEMADQLDYIVFMTYDLHGQWDYANQFSIDGCSAGNCLRSHVNLTETMLALSMITKAGVSTNKIYVGEASYGRSFGMSDPSCTGPMCTFTGTRTSSTAEPGMCTDTGGYISNAEIYNILGQGNNATTWYDTDSNSDIATWGSNWVAYMSPSTRDSRRGFWQGFNFHGTIDWAVDLQNFADEGVTGDDDDDDEDYLPYGDLGWTGCSATYASLEAMGDDANIPYWCSAQYLLEFLQTNLTASMNAYDSLMAGGYDSKFQTYSDAVVKGSSKEVYDFMMANGNKYFTCEVNEVGYCCSKCSRIDTNPGACTYCFDGDDCCTSSPTKRELLMRDGAGGGGGSGGSYCGLLESPKTEFIKTPEPCPPDYSKRGAGQGDPSVDTVWWTIIPEQKAQFYADIYDATGIAEDDLSFQDINNSECSPGETLEQCQEYDWDLGIPAPYGFTTDDVLNPKDTVSKAYGNLENIKGADFNTVIQQVTDGSYAGSPMDLVDALALPIFMISEAVDGMNAVVGVADEIDKEKKEAIIFGFLSAIFFFIPVAGEIAGSIAELAGIARIAELIGALGNSAMDIYQVVDTHGNAPLAIFDLITGPLALLDIAAVSKAASIRRGMSKDDEAKLGKVKDKLDLVEKVKSRGVCKLEKKKKRSADLELSAPQSARANMPRNAAINTELNGFLSFGSSF